MTFKFTRRSLMAAMPLMASSASLLAGCGGGDDAVAASAEDTALKFDASTYTTVNVTLDGVALKVRQYRRVYVAKPIKMASTQPTLMGTTTTMADPYAYQTLIVSVAETLVSDHTKPIYMVVGNSGWFTSAVKTSVVEGAALLSTNNTDAVGSALKAGFVVVDVGTRSRGARAADGRWAGKAPSPVVDTKAAIRYLRLNDSLLPGNTNRIILTGTSGGGGLTSVVAASGNSTDYFPFLADIGAAGMQGTGTAATSTLKDDVFAAVAYCPINNLGNADAGYEWEYNATRNDSNTGALGGVAYSAGPQPAASTAIAGTFAAYLNGLGLTREDGSALTDANMRDTTQALLKKEIEAQLAKGTAVPALGANFTVGAATYLNDWLTLAGSGASATVASIDYAKYLAFVTKIRALKTVVAFDPVGVTGNPNISGETNLFGSDFFAYSNFTAWSWANNSVKGDGSGVEDTGLAWDAYLASSSTNNLATQLKLINPIAYLNTSADTAPYWYVRHGMIDRDTAFAMQTLLYYAIKKDASVKEVDFKYPYLVPHSGNYDVQEAFGWIKAKLATNP
nr:subtype B tannase [uncultured Albidiferax sp.]